MNEKMEIQALGYAFGFCCGLLDEGIDPRKYDQAEFLKKAMKDLNISEEDDEE